MLCAKCVNKVEKIRICLGDGVVEDNDHDQVRQFGGALNKMEFFFFFSFHHLLLVKLNGQLKCSVSLTTLTSEFRS